VTVAENTEHYEQALDDATECLEGAARFLAAARWPASKGLTRRSSKRVSA
jgi:hypothetical protein